MFMQDSHWRPLLFEMIGTAILMLCGLSVVIFMFGSGSPMEWLIPNAELRRPITGFLFGSVGASIALSKVGEVSGAHLNPAVTLAFRFFGKLDLGTTLRYIAAQLAGAVLGCLPLLLWGKMGESVGFGSTAPGPDISLTTAFWGEVITTFSMLTLLTLFLGFRSLRPYTPAIFPPLYSFMSWVESPISGCSTNPARSFGPAVISGQWEGWWIYWAGPLTGTILACLACSVLAKRIEVAKLYHFDSDHDRLFRRRPVGTGQASGG
jgi:aquaporin Z